MPASQQPRNQRFANNANTTQQTLCGLRSQKGLLRGAARGGEQQVELARLGPVALFARRTRGLALLQRAAHLGQPLLAIGEGRADLDAEGLHEVISTAVRNRQHTRASRKLRTVGARGMPCTRRAGQ